MYHLRDELIKAKALIRELKKQSTTPLQQNELEKTAQSDDAIQSLQQKTKHQAAEIETLRKGIQDLQEAVEAANKTIATLQETLQEKNHLIQKMKSQLASQEIITYKNVGGGVDSSSNSLRKFRNTLSPCTIFLTKDEEQVLLAIILLLLVFLAVLV